MLNPTDLGKLVSKRRLITDRNGGPLWDASPAPTATILSLKQRDIIARIKCKH